MAREGIYVGNHEIVERYVGDKLVWQKWKFLNSFTTNIEATFPSDKKHAFLPFSPIQHINTFHAGNRGRILVKYSNSRGSGSVIVRNVYRYGYESNANSSLVIEFYTEQDAKKFNDSMTVRTTLEIYN